MSVKGRERGGGGGRGDTDSIHSKDSQCCCTGVYTSHLKSVLYMLNSLELLLLLFNVSWCGIFELGQNYLVSF